MNEPRHPATDSERVGALFGEALEASAEKRRELLATAALDAPEVAAAVASLLAAHERRGILDTDLDPAKASQLLEAVALEPAPSTIGPYRLVSELGRGGMGVVYLAERTAGGFEQRVALKLVKRGMDSEAILARFRQERQILARLEHPGIARLLDGGLTEDGQPYFAMEYVEAEPITHYCSRSELALQERLALFATVCQAVQYAHRQLVVHRDLKPSNVLVTAEGAVKLVDFGIAKLLDPDSAGAAATGLTRHGLRALTPEYASPEQIRGETVTVASDVYALGVLLYEILVGQSPYPAALTTPAEIHRAVCETEPQAPSAAALQGDVAGSGDRKQLARRLRGDLDTVVLKALGKDAAHRYPSVEAFLDDLERYTSGMPVRARRTGWPYRAKKFVGRHRVAVTAAVVALVALVLGLAGTAWQATTAARERDRAQLESAKLAATEEFLVGLFEAADPAEALGQDVTAKQLVARGVGRLESDLDDQPEVRLEMLRALSRVSLALGEYGQTELLLEQSLPLARTLYGDDHLTVAEILVSVGRLHNARGAWDQAESSLREALEIYDRLQGFDRALVLRALAAFAETRVRQGDLQQAVALQRQALAEARLLGGEDSFDVAALLNNLGNSLKNLNDYTGAEGALMEALAIQRRVRAAEHPEIATAMVNLAAVRTRKGDWQGAEALYRDGIAMERRVRGDHHPRLAIKLHNFASLLNALGRYEEAASLHREAVVLLREGMGEASPYYATALDSLANDLAEGGHFEEATRLFARAQGLLATTVGPDHEFSINNLWRQARAQYLQARDQTALPLIEQAIRLTRRSERVDTLALMLAERGVIQRELGALAAAEADCREALLIQRQNVASNHPNLVSTLGELGWTLLAAEDVAEATEVLREAVAVADTSLPLAHWRRAEARAGLGAALIAAGRSAEGEPLLREAYQQLSSARGTDHPASRRAGRYLPTAP